MMHHNRNARVNNRKEASAEIPAEFAAEGGGDLIPQPHGGALLAGGMPGHRGGSGRPRESLRARMRELLDGTLNAMSAALRGERLAHDAYRRLLNDPRISSLGVAARDAIEEAAREHLTAVLSPREIATYHETLARYGVGVQHEQEIRKTQVRYVVRLPVRREAAAGASATNPIAVIEETTARGS